MNDNEAIPSDSLLRRQPWNKGKLIGAKPPPRASHVWSAPPCHAISDIDQALVVSQGDRICDPLADYNIPST